MQPLQSVDQCVSMSADSIAAALASKLCNYIVKRMYNLQETLEVTYEFPGSES